MGSPKRSVRTLGRRITDVQLRMEHMLTMKRNDARKVLKTAILGTEAILDADVCIVDITYDDDDNDFKKTSRAFIYVIEEAFNAHEFVSKTSDDYSIVESAAKIMKAEADLIKLFNRVEKPQKSLLRRGDEMLIGIKERCWNLEGALAKILNVTPRKQYTKV